jgi:hypothetical protein
VHIWCESVQLTSIVSFSSHLLRHCSCRRQKKYEVREAQGKEKSIYAPWLRQVLSANDGRCPQALGPKRKVVFEWQASDTLRRCPLPHIFTLRLARTHIYTHARSTDLRLEGRSHNVRHMVAVALQSHTGLVPERTVGHCRQVVCRHRDREVCRMYGTFAGTLLSQRSVA